MATRCPNGDLPMIAGFIVVRRRLTGVLAVTAGAPADRRRDTGGASAGNFVICRVNRAVAGRRPLHDFYDMVQGRENPPMTCRCQKVGIGEKSAGHRSIYKACDVGLSCISSVQIQLQTVYLGVSLGCAYTKSLISDCEKEKRIGRWCHT